MTEEFVNLAKRAIINDDIKEALREAIRIEEQYKDKKLPDKKIDLPKHPLSRFVEYQLRLCRDNKLTLAEEGFQVGESWGGDLRKAKILFLGPNPAITAKCVSPRYDICKKEFFLPPGKWRMKEGDEAIKRIMDFYTNRFDSFPMDKQCRFTVDVIGKNGNPVPRRDYVRYWHGVMMTAHYLTSESKNFEKNNDYDAELCPKERAKKRRELMRQVVLAELVPFGSMKSNWVNNKTVDICWENFTKEIIEKSVAPVFILTGVRVKEHFLRKAITEKKENERARHAFENNEIYNCNFGDLPRKVVFVNHLSQYTYNFFDRYSNSEVSKILRETIKEHDKK